MMRARRALALTLLLLAVARGGWAQSPASQLIERARALIDEFGYDSSYGLLRSSLEPAANATLTERQRGLVLYGIVALLRSNGEDVLGARQAFEQALRVNPAYALPDSLAELHSAARSVFNEARNLMAPTAPVAPAPVAAAALSVQLAMPPDITLPADTGRLRFESTPSRPARVVLQIAPADVPNEIVWADTQQVQTGAATHAWNLRSLRERALVAEGRYAVRVRAIDELSQVSGTIERILAVSRVAVDTTAHPAPLTPSAFQPETLRLRRASPAVLLVGLGVGAAAYIMPTALGNTQLNSGRAGDGTAIAVAGAASLAGIYGFLAGSRARHSPQNVRANQELRQRHATQTADIIRRNRAARDAAAVRVRVEQ